MIDAVNAMCVCIWYTCV